MPLYCKCRTETAASPVWYLHVVRHRAVDALACMIASNISREISVLSMGAQFQFITNFLQII